MKKHTKSILLTLMILLVSISIIACDGENVDLTNIKGSMGELEELVEKDENLETIFHLPNGEMLKLKASKDFLDEFTIGDNYTFAYDESIGEIVAFDYIEVKEEKNNDPILEEDVKSIPISSGKVDVDSLTLVSTVETVVTDTDREDLINLYTSAMEDENGELMLDDGQEWKLIVHTENGDFVLFDEYVQGMPLELYVFTEDGDFRIATVQAGTANLTLTEYRYDVDSNTFQARTGYNAIDNINMIYMR